MTTVIAPPPPAGQSAAGEPPTDHPLVRFVASLTGALDRLEKTPTWSMTPEEERTFLVELHNQRARLAELELRALVRADRDGDAGRWSPG